MAPRGLPVARSRAQRFDDLVLDAVERLERRFPAELGDVEFAVEDVPDPDRGGRVDGILVDGGLVDGAFDGQPDRVHLGDVLAARADHPATIVLYRRPIELRTLDAAELADLVQDVLIEQVAELLGLTAAEVDPSYDEGADD